MSENQYTLPPDVEIKRLGDFRALDQRIDWSHKFLGTDSLTNRGTVGGKPLRICILDTGCDLKHRDLEGAILTAEDFTGSRFGAQDMHGHGTWCAGFVAARSNTIGVEGIVPESLLVISKVLGDNGSGDENAIFRGIELGIRYNCDLFSMSLGGPRMGDRLYGLIRELSQEGKLFFAATGNDGGGVNYPAAWAECIATGAVDKDGKLTDFTSRGPELDILAPGYEMESLAPGNGYATMSGTSMATPCACAIAASVLGSYEDFGDRSLRSAEKMTLKLQSSGSDVGGYKLINPREILAGLQVKEQEHRLGPVKLGTWEFYIAWRKAQAKAG